MPATVSERQRPRWRLLLALLAVMAVVVAACGNSGDDEGAAPNTTAAAGTTAPSGKVDLDKFVKIDETGVSDDTIRVGSVTSMTNPLGTDFSDFNSGIKGFFETVNREGGIYGRDLELVAERDDQLGNNLTEVEGLLAQDNVFAVFNAALLFTGAQKLADERVPTFGWNIQNEWALSDGFFPNAGVICFRCVGRPLLWLADKIGAKQIGVLAYDVPQAAECAEGSRDYVKQHGNEVGLELGFFDSTIAFGQADVSAQVSAMKDAGVDFIWTCMDFNGVFTVAKEMKRQDMDATILHANMYNQEFVAANADLFEGDYVNVRFTAFEHKPQIEAVQTFLDESKRQGFKVRELTVEGWLAAKQFYDALVATGPDFDREKLISAWNGQPDPYTADGWLSPLEWPKQHTDFSDDPAATPDLSCTNLVKVQDGKFVSAFAEPGKPWICWDGKDQTSLATKNYSFEKPPG